MGEAGRGGASDAGGRYPPHLRVLAEGLAAGRGAVRIVAPQSFVLLPGEALVVTGENGAGKSTFLRTLAGLLPPLQGRCRVEGALAPDGEPAVRLADAAHYVGHRNAMKPGDSVRSNLLFWQRMLGARGEGAPTPESALEALGLPGLAPLAHGSLSAGQQRRAALARLLVAPRPVWILDEPTAALDAGSQARFAGLLADHLDRGGIVVAATHQPLGLGTARDLHLAGGAGGDEPRGHGAGEDGPRESDAALAAAEGWL